MRDEVCKWRDDFSSGTFGSAKCLFKAHNNEKNESTAKKTDAQHKNHIYY